MTIITSFGRRKLETFGPSVFAQISVHLKQLSRPIVSKEAKLEDRDVNIKIISLVNFPNEISIRLPQLILEMTFLSIPRRIKVGQKI